MRSAIVRVGLYGCAGLMVAFSLGGSLLASPTVPTPEIDGNSLTTAVGVLAAGALILRARFGSK